MPPSYPLHCSLPLLLSRSSSAGCVVCLRVSLLAPATGPPAPPPDTVASTHKQRRAFTDGGGGGPGEGSLERKHTKSTWPCRISQAPYGYLSPSPKSSGARRSSTLLASQLLHDFTSEGLWKGRGLSSCLRPPTCPSVFPVACVVSFLPFPHSTLFLPSHQRWRRWSDRALCPPGRPIRLQHTGNSSRGLSSKVTADPIH